MISLKFTCVTDEVKPLLPHLNPDDALSLQLRVDGGELSSECFIVDHFLDIAPKFSIIHISIHEYIIDSIFTLIALCRASSAKLQDFDQDIDIEFEASKGTPLIKKNWFLSGIARKGGGWPCPNFLTFFPTMLSLIFWHQYHVK